MPASLGRKPISDPAVLYHLACYQVAKLLLLPCPDCPLNIVHQAKACHRRLTCPVAGSLHFVAPRGCAIGNTPNLLTVKLHYCRHCQARASTAASMTRGLNGGLHANKARPLALGHVAPNNPDAQLVACAHSPASHSRSATATGVPASLLRKAAAMAKSVCLALLGAALLIGSACAQQQLAGVGSDGDLDQCQVCPSFIEPHSPDRYCCVAAPVCQSFSAADSYTTFH